MRFKAVHQIVPVLVEGDAISDYALLLQSVFRSWGLASYIFVSATSLRTRRVESLSRLPERLGATTALLYHHSMGCSAADKFAAVSGAVRMVVYHNITPPHLLNLVPAVAARCHWGLQQLRMLAQTSLAGIADSEFNRQDLHRAGFRASYVLPLAISEKRRKLLELIRAQKMSAPGASGARQASARFLHVGRVIPHKRLEDVIRVFAMYQGAGHSSASLDIVGDFRETPEYGKMLRQLIAANRLKGVAFAGKVSEGQLMEHYHKADLYLCMSRHEGFCMPLVECMFAGVPVVCAAAGAIPETVGGASLVVEESDPAMFAEAADVILSAPELRQKIQRAQYQRAQLFTLPALCMRLQKLFAQFA